MSHTWPDDLFNAPLLRGLSQHARTRIEQAGSLQKMARGEQIFAAQTPGDSLYIVHAGVVSLVATRRGDDLPAQVRVARRGESFGEGAALPGGTHRLTARVAEDATIAVIPVGVLTRETARQDRESKGASSVAARQQRLLTRQATRDLLSTMALTRDLSRDETDLLLDAVEVTAAPRGHRIYDVHDPADGLYMLSSGLVQLQTQDEGRIHVRAYLSAGDFFGDRELLTGETRVHAAVAMGACQLLMLPASAFRTLRDRNPGLVKRMRRIADDRDDAQAKVVEEAGAHTTRHVFADLYRMQMAQSMLTIDQDTCVRCGHCAWSCADTHGVARLVRRGDKILTSVSGETHNLLLPNSCQHCQNPACMIDCPTGAIGRDPRGEVFIREELCTGCGACAKACPWENIRMAPRTPATGLIPLTQLLKKNRAPTTPTSPTGLPSSPTNSPSHSQVGTSPEVATKCDLCRGYEAPACVQACPTGSLIRLDPKQAFSEVAALLGDREQSTQKAGPTKQHRLGNLGLAAVTITTIMAAGSAAALNLRGILEPGTGFGLTLGMLAAVAMLLLVGHSIPKRITRLWMRKRSRSGARTKAPPPARSRLKPLVQLHILLGLLLPAAVLGHAGTTISGTVAGSLHVSLWVLLVLGIWGAIAYRLLPPVLGRLERRGALPEDLVDRRQHLLDRMQRELSGRTPDLKRVARALLLPYAHASLGHIGLLLSGRSLRDEQARLHAHVTSLFDPEHHSRLAGLDDIVRTAVDLRALPARRLLHTCLRAWLIPHILVSGWVLILLCAHILDVRDLIPGGWL